MSLLCDFFPRLANLVPLQRGVCPIVSVMAAQPHLPTSQPANRQYENQNWPNFPNSTITLSGRKVQRCTKLFCNFNIFKPYIWSYNQVQQSCDKIRPRRLFKIETSSWPLLWKRVSKLRQRVRSVTRAGLNVKVVFACPSSLYSR